jgi:hypothetical protein
MHNSGQAVKAQKKEFEVRELQKCQDHTRYQEAEFPPAKPLYHFYMLWSGVRSPAGTERQYPQHSYFERVELVNPRGRTRQEQGRHPTQPQERQAEQDGSIEQVDAVHRELEKKAMAVTKRVC